MEEGPSSSSGFSTRATAPLQEPPVNLVHSMISLDEEDPADGGVAVSGLLFLDSLEAHREYMKAINKRREG
jgi:hypothetical protein